MTRASKNTVKSGLTAHYQLGNCNTIQVAYHEAYWIGVATAAPLIALANTVSITDVVGVWFTSTVQHRSSTSKWGYFTVLFGSAGNLVIQAVIMFVALNNLLNENDGNVSPIPPELFLLFGLIYIPLILFADIRLRYVLRRDESAEKKTKTETPVDEARSVFETDTEAGKKMSGLGWPIVPPSSQ